MDNCVVCGVPVAEECPYCEACLDDISRAAEIEIAKHEAMINSWAADVQAKHDEWHRLLDLANDDRKIRDLDSLKAVMDQARQAERSEEHTSELQSR